MTGAELDEVEDRIRVALNCQCTSASVPIPILRKLIAKVRAAVKLSDVAEAAMCNDDMDLIDAIDEFCKAGEP